LRRIDFPSKKFYKILWKINNWKLFLFRKRRKCVNREKCRRERVWNTKDTDLTPGLAQPPIQYVHSIGIKLYANHWPPLRAELNTWRHFSTSSYVFIMRCLIKRKNNVTIRSICCKIWYCLNIKGNRRKTFLVTQQCNIIHVLVFGNGTNVNVRERDIVMKG
jgi:hypothetical protein